MKKLTANLSDVRLVNPDYDLARSLSAAVNLAKDLSCLNTMIPLFQRLALGDMRYNTSQPVNLKAIDNTIPSWDWSDVVTQIAAVIAIDWKFRHDSRMTEHSLCQLANINYKKYRKFTDTIGELEDKFQKSACVHPYISTDAQMREELAQVIKPVLFLLQINQRYIARNAASVFLPQEGDDISAKLAYSSMVRDIFAEEGVFVTGQPRAVTPEVSPDFYLIDEITVFTVKDIIALTRTLSRELVNPDGIFDPNIILEESSPTKVPVIKEGTFGDLLKEALLKV